MLSGSEINWYKGGGHADPSQRHSVRIAPRLVRHKLHGKGLVVLFRHLVCHIGVRGRESIARLSRLQSVTGRIPL